MRIGKERAEAKAAEAQGALERSRRSLETTHAQTATAVQSMQAVQVRAVRTLALALQPL